MQRKQKDHRKAQSKDFGSVGGQYSGKPEKQKPTLPWPSFEIVRFFGQIFGRGSFEENHMLEDFGSISLVIVRPSQIIGG